MATHDAVLAADEDTSYNPFLPGEPRGQGSLVGYSPRGRKESGTTELTAHTPLATSRAPVSSSAAVPGRPKASSFKHVLSSLSTCLPQDFVQSLRMCFAYMQLVCCRGHFSTKQGRISDPISPLPWSAILWRHLLQGVPHSTESHCPPWWLAGYWPFPLPCYSLHTYSDLLESSPNKVLL